MPATQITPAEARKIASRTREGNEDMDGSPVSANAATMVTAVWQPLLQGIASAALAQKLHGRSDCALIAIWSPLRTAGLPPSGPSRSRARPGAAADVPRLADVLREAAHVHISAGQRPPEAALIHISAGKRAAREPHLFT